MPHSLLHLPAERRLTLSLPRGPRPPFFVRRLITLCLAVNICHAFERSDVPVRHDKARRRDTEPSVMPTREPHLLEARVQSVQASRMRSMQQRLMAMVMCAIVVGGTGAASTFTRVLISHSFGHCGQVVVVQWRM